MKKEKSSIIYSLETVAVFRNGSRRQGLLKLQLKDSVFCENIVVNILMFYQTDPQQICNRL